MITLGQSSSSSATYNVSWKSQQTHIAEGLRDLLRQDFVLTDVTLACEGEYIQAHKVVLSLCSSFFKDLFQKNRADKSNTIVILGNVNAQNMRYLLHYMYEGKVSLPNYHVDGFLKAGIALKVGGLANTSEKDIEQIKPVMLRTSSGKSSVHPTSQSNAKKQASKDRDNDSDDGGPLHDERNEEDDDAEHDYETNKPLTRVPVKTEPEENVNEDSNELNEECELEDEGTNDATWVPKRSPNAASLRRRGGRGSRAAIVKKSFAFSEVTSRRRRSVVWKFFDPNPEHTYATCKLCTEDKVQLKTPMSSTSGLLNHIINIHPGILATAPTRVCRKNRIVHTVNSDSLPSTSSVNPSSNAAPSSQQSSSNSNAEAHDTK